MTARLAPATEQRDHLRELLAALQIRAFSLLGGCPLPALPRYGALLKGHGPFLSHPPKSLRRSIPRWGESRKLV